MTKNKPIIFYFPYHGVGGVSTLFLRLAEVLKNEYPVFLADFSDGFMAKNLPDGVSMISIDSNPKFPSNSIFIFQSFLPWRFPFLSKVSPDSKIIFWGLHPQNFDPRIFNENHRMKIVSSLAKVMNIVSVQRRHKLVEIIRYLLDKNAIVFQGRENVKATEKLLRFSIDEAEFLPLPIPAVNKYKEAPSFPKTLECGWIGRICDFKYRILEHIIYRLASISEAIGPVRLTIIGNGEYRDYIEKIAYNLKSKNFSVEFKGEMEMSLIPDYLIGNIDILFAMGTSALEGARVGIPVFLTDFIYKKITNNYCFKYLFDNPNCSLGEEITDDHYEDKSSLEKSIKEIIDNYEKYSKLTYEYWAEHFSIDTAKVNLMKYADVTTATFGEMSDLGFFKPDFFGRILRSASVKIRTDISSKVVGFRHDC